MEAPVTETPSPPVLLCVDDEPNILSALRRLFRPQGYRVHVAESGALGLELMASEPVDLVISDMRMPHMDGATFLGQVRQGWPDAVRILLTGYADMTSTIEAINRGEIYRYITKPWVDSDMLLTVQQALERKNLEQEKRRLEALTRSQNEELRQLNDSLERKVQERTAELQKSNEKLKASFINSIKIFSSLIELRNPALAGHSRRVAALARSLAKKMGMDDKSAQDVFLAGLLHDIGKIGFPDKLIGRPTSTLNHEDLQVYRKHPLSGVHALMAFEEVGPAARIMRHHHERYDGHGFPDGLRGQDIPLGARVLALANDFDSLQIGTFSPHSHTPNEAKQVIEKDSGKRYDPAVVKALFDLIGAPPRQAAKELRLSLAELKPGMVLSRDFVSTEGALLLGADHLLDAKLIEKMQAYEKSEGRVMAVHVLARE
jgi:putative nucleotidyltransferase with HDIG domain